VTEDVRAERPVAVRTVWVGDPDLAEELGRAIDGVEPVAVRRPEPLRSALDEAAACVVVGDPPSGLRPALSSASVPVVAYVDGGPADAPPVADDFVRRTGDGFDRLVDRVRWHAARTDASEPRADGRSKVEQLHDIATDLVVCRDEDAVYELAVDAAERVLAFDVCTIDAVEDGHLVPAAVSEETPDDGYEPAPVEDAGLAGEAVRTGESSVIDDVTACATADPATDEYRSILTVPVGDAAVLQAASTAVGAFGESDRELAELLAAHAAGAVHRIRSERAIERRRKTIERLHDIVARMVACDSETELYDLLIEAAEEVLAFNVCVVVVDDPDAEGLVVRAASDDELAPPVGEEVPDDRERTWHTYRTGEASLTRDVADDEIADPRDDRYRSGLSVPMGDLGVVQAISTTPGDFDEHDLEMAELLASQAGTVATRLRAEARLRAEHDRFRSLFEHVPDPAVSYAFEDGEPLVRDVNPAFEATFGFDAETVVRENVDELIVPEDELAAADELNEQFQAGESLHREVRRRTADGDLRDFIIHVVPTDRSTDNVAGFSIYTDITDRKRRERRLDSLNRTTRELLGAGDADAVCEIAVGAAREILSLPITGVYRPDGDALVPAAASASAWELFDGPPPTFGPGDEVWDAFQAGDQLLVEAPSVEFPTAEAAVEAMLVLPLGDYGVVVSGAPADDVFDEGTRDLAGVLAANVEAALARAAREHRLRERDRELQRQNDRLEEFASVVSHDLRTPLSVARGQLELARREHDSETLGKVADAHERMDTLIDDLLTLAREGRVVGSTEPLDLAAAAETAWAAAGAADASLELADPGTVEADRDRLLQLLENLFRNAVEHGSTGSRPEADHGRESGASAVTVEVGRFDADGRAGFYVADDGPGIPPAERERVFERGYSTAASGTGFGLAIVREIADAHGWSVEVTDCETLGGARFEIRTE
jgi:PAS domain S-box-containing protein